MDDEGDHRPLTRHLAEQAEVDSLDLDLDLDDEDREDREDRAESGAGHRLLAALAAESGGRMRRVGPGVWLESKIGREPPID
jgi:hypothetical protein